MLFSFLCFAIVGSIVTNKKPGPAGKNNTKSHVFVVPFQFFFKLCHLKFVG